LLVGEVLDVDAIGEVADLLFALLRDMGVCFDVPARDLLVVDDAVLNVDSHAFECFFAVLCFVEYFFGFVARLYASIVEAGVRFFHLEASAYFPLGHIGSGAKRSEVSREVIGGCNG
jgi:hypothetical protein